MLLATTAQAAGEPYGAATPLNYAGVGIINEQVEVETTPPAEADTRGFLVDVSFAFPWNFYLHASHESHDEDAVDFTRTDLGVGGYMQLSESVLGYVEAAVVDFEADDGTTSEDESGNRVGLGFNVLLLPGFRLSPELGVIDLGDFGDGEYIKVGADIGIGEGFAVFASYRLTQIENDSDIESDNKQAVIGLRYTGFGFPH